MATEKWVGGSGQGLTWGSAFNTSTLASIASGNAIMSSCDIANGTPLDIFADVSVQLGGLNVAAPNFVGVYLYPLNSDGATYGDGRFATSAAGPPPSTYSIGSIGMVVANSSQSGTLLRVVLPPGTFRFVIYNQVGVAFGGSSNVCLYRTYNRSVA